MKPRLESAPLTSEDSEIFCNRNWHDHATVLENIGYDSDCRDAKLMFEQSWRCPGYAVIYFEFDGIVMCHNIAGRKVHEELERTRDPDWPRRSRPHI